jgi:hypothetical protein
MFLSGVTDMGGLLLSGSLLSSSIARHRTFGKVDISHQQTVELALKQAGLDV